MKKILFVCHGNICRSPMAEFVMKDMLEKAKLSYLAQVDSAATSTEEIGNDVHPGTKRKLREEGIPFSKRGAVQVKNSDYDKYDWIIGMDQWNIRNLVRRFGGDPDGKVRLLLSFAGSQRDIADPWFTGDFDATYDDVVEGCKGLLKELKAPDKKKDS